MLTAGLVIVPALALVFWFGVLCCSVCFPALCQFPSLATRCPCFPSMHLDYLLTFSLLLLSLPSFSYSSATWFLTYLHTWNLTLLCDLFSCLCFGFPAQYLDSASICSPVRHLFVWTCLWKLSFGSASPWTLLMFVSYFLLKWNCATAIHLLVLLYVLLLLYVLFFSHTLMWQDPSLELHAVLVMTHVFVLIFFFWCFSSLLFSAAHTRHTYLPGL